MATGLSALILEVLFVGGMVLFGLGFFWRVRRERQDGALSRVLVDNHKHLFRIGAWTVFGVYWFALFPEYMVQDDLINALGTAVALPMFLFLAYHEYLSWRWREEYEPLRFLAGAAFFATLVYFVVDRLPPLGGAYIHLVADHTAGMLSWLDQNYLVGAIEFAGNTGWYRVNAAEIRVPLLDPSFDPAQRFVNIVLACTAVQGIAVAAALIFSTRDPPKRKVIAVAIIFPATYVMNLVRNTMVVHYYYNQGVDFDLVHSGYGKGLSLIVTAVLLILAFYLLPELYVMLNGLYDLPWRKKPGWDYRSKVGALFKSHHAKLREADASVAGAGEAVEPPSDPPT